MLSQIFFFLKLKLCLDSLKAHVVLKNLQSSAWPCWEMLEPSRVGASWEVFWSLGMCPWRVNWSQILHFLHSASCSWNWLSAHHMLTPGCEASAKARSKGDNQSQAVVCRTEPRTPDSSQVARYSVGKLTNRKGAAEHLGSGQWWRSQLAWGRGTGEKHRKLLDTSVLWSERHQRNRDYRKQWLKYYIPHIKDSKLGICSWQSKGSWPGIWLSKYDWEEEGSVTEVCFYLIHCCQLSCPW